MDNCDICNKPAALTEDDVTGDMTCQSCQDNAAERAYDRAMERAAESSDSADEWYRRQLIDAGRGHLVRR